MNELIVSAGAHAFGDGAHPTTRGVLAALQAIDPALFTPAQALDIGAGSGIISFAIVERFACPVLATDIEKTAVETIDKNARSNHLTDKIKALHADGFDHPDIAASAPYDLITMNILAEPLLRLAEAAVVHLATGGVLILSGILQWQEPQLQQAYESLGLERTFRLEIGDWVTLVWQKP